MNSGPRKGTPREGASRLLAAEMLARTAPAQIYEWTARDYFVYALALGTGENPLDRAALPFVYERESKVVPTFPTVLAWIAEPTFAELGAHPDFALHSGQSIELHQALTGPTSVTVNARAVAVHDKGPQRGAVIVMRQQIARRVDAAPLATLTTTCFARDAGGCGSGGEPAVPPHAVPTRPPDHIINYAVRPDAALLYRLTGDRNPLHADPDAAHAAGFERPILHGLCTFGMNCRAVLENILAWQAERIASFEARFSAPVYPGENLQIKLWRDGAVVSFEARVAERDVRVLTNGKCVVCT